MRKRKRKQKHLIHHHQNNYEARTELACVQTHRQSNAKLKLGQKIVEEKASWRKITIKKIFLRLVRGWKAPLCGKKFLSVFIGKYADFKFSCTLKGSLSSAPGDNFKL